MPASATKKPRVTSKLVDAKADKLISNDMAENESKKKRKKLKGEHETLADRLRHLQERNA